MRPMDTNDRVAAREPLTFQATVGGSGNVVDVPPEILAALGTARRPAVRVVVNGVELRTTLAAYGGGSQIGFRRELREAARLVPGETVEVRIALDLEPREVPLPDDLAAALDADPDARRIFDGLSFTNRKEYASWVLAAKTTATRKGRVDEAPHLLKSG